ncbi:hypothetical protein [Tsukamurella strandjordii]|uniref:Uncharacterized protein n=1 Tax=Tsukamurella strandjordii TaxID=147577 RepID=A0AA90SIR9_9ACTN|nr:hypothetical protein [Tsukamurella strandjordii]MDP0400389.1 hypothetical protein [Tsukamurella strandjordii]
MSRRVQRRDRLGRFAGAGSKVVGSTKVATANAGKKATKSVGNAYVAGSFERHLTVGQGGAYRGAKVGAEFKTPAGRGVLVKGIVGYHGRPDRRLDITPSLDKAHKKLTVTAKLNPARRSAAAGTKVRR